MHGDTITQYLEQSFGTSQVSVNKCLEKVKKKIEIYLYIMKGKIMSLLGKWMELRAYC